MIELSNYYQIQLSMIRAFWILFIFHHYLKGALRSSYFCRPHLIQDDLEAIVQDLLPRSGTTSVDCTIVNLNGFEAHST